MKATTTGRAIVAMTAAVRMPQSTSYWAMNAPRATGSVLLASSTVKAEAHPYSVQDQTHEKIAAAAIPVAVSGWTIENRVRILPAPSTDASSSIPAGMEPKKPRMGQTLKGAVKVTFTITGLSRLSKRPTTPMI